MATKLAVNSNESNGSDNLNESIEENVHGEKRQLNENDGGINQRPVRKKVRPDHLGITDGNYNDFIEEINSNATSSSSSTITEPPDADKKCDCIELLNLLLKKSDAIADHLIKLDVKINHLDSAPSNTRKVIKMGIVTMDQLKQFGLPAESVLDLENLDEKLKNDFEFKTKLSKCIENIGGDSGNADGEIVIEKIVHSLISTRFLADISYTGKGKQKERKVALCRYTHVLEFIQITTNKADNSFNDAVFKDKLIYGILKRAPSKYGGSSKSGDDKGEREKEKEKAKKAARSNTSNDVVEKPSLHDTPVSQTPPIPQPQQHHLDYHVQNHYPSNGQPPISDTPTSHPPNPYPLSGQPPMAYYPSNQPNQAGHSQQHQPYYYGQQANFNGPNQMPLLTGAPPAAGANYGHPPSTYFHL